MTGELEARESFEVLYSRLEEVTNALEGGQLTLEESMSLYEEGMRLAQRCQALLADVEQRVQVLRETYDSGFDQ
ncbi:MAG: exodeoxyribonuclease VII small subunit [Dehalococcoidia bacterium]